MSDHKIIDRLTGKDNYKKLQKAIKDLCRLTQYADMNPMVKSEIGRKSFQLEAILVLNEDWEDSKERKRVNNILKSKEK